MPWQSRHKNRRDRAALIAVATIGALALAVLFASNLALIARVLALFTTTG